MEVFWVYKNEMFQYSKYWVLLLIGRPDTYCPAKRTYIEIIVDLTTLEELHLQFHKVSILALDMFY